MQFQGGQSQRICRPTQYEAQEDKERSLCKLRPCASCNEGERERREPVCQEGKEITHPLCHGTTYRCKQPGDTVKHKGQELEEEQVPGSPNPLKISLSPLMETLTLTLNPNP